MRVAGVGHRPRVPLADGGRRRRSASGGARSGLVWLGPRQVLDTVGDWAEQRPRVRPGGWAFQYANPHYPDLDDTAVVVMAMDRVARRLEISGRRRLQRGHRARSRVGAGLAEHEWRVGRVRRRQHQRISESHTVCRPRRAAGPADRRRDRALRQHDRAARRRLGQARHWRQRSRSCAGLRSATAAGTGAGE